MQAIQVLQPQSLRPQSQSPGAPAPLPERHNDLDDGF